MSVTIYSIIAIAIAAICTFATRLVPFALFGGKKEAAGRRRSTYSGILFLRGAAFLGSGKKPLFYELFVKFRVEIVIIL